MSGIGLPVNTHFLMVPALGHPEQVQLLNHVTMHGSIFSHSLLPSLVCWLWLHGGRVAAAVPVITTVFKDPYLCFE